jgi:hypothetical protein
MKWPTEWYVWLALLNAAISLFERAWKVAKRIIGRVGPVWLDTFVEKTAWIFSCLALVLGLAWLCVRLSGGSPPANIGWVLPGLAVVVGLAWLLTWWRGRPTKPETPSAPALPPFAIVKEPHAGFPDLKSWGLLHIRSAVEVAIRDITEATERKGWLRIYTEPHPLQDYMPPALITDPGGDSCDKPRNLMPREALLVRYYPDASEGDTLIIHYRGSDGQPAEFRIPFAEIPTIGIKSGPPC